MTAMTYTLTGFAPFLELRRVTFLEPLPAVRVCSVCGMVPSCTALLPCCHVVCKGPCGRQVETDKRCPLDGRLVTAASIMQHNFEQSELEQLLVHCLNGADNCSFTCKLGELRGHVSECFSDIVECAKCRRQVRRDAAASHCRTCGGSATSTTGDVCGDVVEEVARMREDLEKLRGRVSEEDTVNAVVVNDVNSLAQRAVHLEAQLVSLVKENAKLKGPILAGSPDVMVATGPVPHFNRFAVVQ
ncbi:RING finger protein 151 [Rhipicephalus sanguineus]|nr:RING finger protein 151 [Rhipicephalus sanguineus]